MDGPKGDFGRKVLKDSAPDPIVAEELAKLSALKVLEDAKKAIDALEGPDDDKKKEMKDTIEDSEKILLGYVPNNKPEASPFIKQLDIEDWLEKLKQKIIAFDPEASQDPADAPKAEGEGDGEDAPKAEGEGDGEDAPKADGEGDGEGDGEKEGDGDAKKVGGLDDPVWLSPLGIAAKDLEKDLDILNTIVVGSEDFEPFIIKEIGKTILEKVDELVKKGVDEIAKNGPVAMTIGNLNETLYPLLKDPVILKKAVEVERCVPVEKGSLKNCVKALRKLGEDPDPFALKGKIKESEKYILSTNPVDKALEATLLILSLACPSKNACKELGIVFTPKGLELGETADDPVDEDPDAKGDGEKAEGDGEKAEGEEDKPQVTDEMKGEGPQTVFGALREVLKAKSDNPLDVYLASCILCNEFDATPHPEFRGKIPLLEVMLTEAVNDREGLPICEPLADYEERIRNKIDQLNDDNAPKAFDIIAEYIALLARRLDPLFGKDEEMKDLNFLAAWFKKLVDMAQPEPLDAVHDDCLRRILKAIQDYPKDKTAFFTMLN